MNPFIPNLSFVCVCVSFPSISADSDRPVQQHHRDGGRRLVQRHNGPGRHADRPEQQVPSLPGSHEM